MINIVKQCLFARYGIKLGKVGLYNIVEKVVKKCLDSIKMIVKKLFEIQKK